MKIILGLADAAILKLSSAGQPRNIVRAGGFSMWQKPFDFFRESALLKFCCWWILYRSKVFKPFQALQKFCHVYFVGFFLLATRSSVAAPAVTNLGGLMPADEPAARAIRSFRIEVVVCSVETSKGLVVLQDGWGVVLLEVPRLDAGLRVGDRVAVVGNDCPLTRAPWGIRAGTAPVVDNDGTHSALEKSGRVFLEAGLNPVRLEWFNAVGGVNLAVEYEGPKISRRRISDSLLCRSADGTNSQPGINYSVFEGEGWHSLPDFSRLRPVATGVATNFITDCRTRADGCAVVFQGFFKIPRAGIYTFHLSSDDGSRLFVGDSGAWCKIIPLGEKSVPQISTLAAATGANTAQWTSLEGEIIFAAQSDVGLELDLQCGIEIVRATVVGSTTSPTNLLHRHVRVTGVCEASQDLAQRRTARMAIPGAELLQFLENTNLAVTTTLTEVREIQRMNPEQARKNLPAKITGVITHASAISLVIQDATGGIFVHHHADDWTEQPRVGDLWEIEGTTDPGDFSPVIFATSEKFLGHAALPEPIRPTWDQLINGSLDAQFVEIRGVVISVSTNGMTVMTPDGNIHVTLDEMRRLYVSGHDVFVNIHGALAPDDTLKSYVGGVVRLRGCVAAVWDTDTRRAKAGELRLVAAVVSVDEPRPVDPFVLPLRTTADLLLFDPRASTLQRTKVAGQIVHAQAKEFFIQDNGSGFRAQVENSPSLQTCDLVEVVGFPRLGGASPIFLSAQIRKTGAQPLPSPQKISAENILDRKLDSTRVELEALLLGDTAHAHERILEMQSGPHHFLARLKISDLNWTPLAAGSRLRLTGVYAGTRESAENLDAFELLLNNTDDILVLEEPSWWTVKHTVAVMAVLAVGLGLAMIWISLLRRKVEERTVQLEKEIGERQSIERRHAIEQERARVAQDLHDELGAGLTEVSMLGSLAKTPAVPADTKERYLDELTQKARSLVTSLDEIVWAVNPQYDSVPSLASYYSLFAQRFLDLAGIAFRPQVANDLPDLPLDSRTRHGVFCEFKEALNNVIQHSSATEVRMNIAVVNGQLTISVHDNGRGFASGENAPGRDGLNGLCQRMKNLGGDCHITSQPGAGTKVEFQLPLNGDQHGQNLNR
jgi:signal transduction histidine kinase